MEETFVSSFIILVVERLNSEEMLNVAMQLGIDSHLKQWNKSLKKIRTVLADAEEKQYVDGDVKKWLNNLDDLAYDLDDTIDDFATEVGQHTQSQASSTYTSQVCNSFSIFKHNYDMVATIYDISTRLQEITEEIDDLNLKENIIGRIHFQSNTTCKRLPSSSLVESHIYGREEDKKVLLEMLFNGEESVGDKCVIPILGMGGVGKTTLAQLLYNDEKVNSCFDLKAWACVSDDFDVPGVTKRIFESLSSQPCDLKYLEPVQVKLKEKLSGKKFLVVLDDIWKIKYEEWELLRRPFLAGARGSKIIVTTRFADVAKLMSRLKTHDLKQLGDDHSLSLLAHHALGRDNFEEHPNLKDIGEKILNKCQGLPLAIKTLGGLLRTIEHHNQWEDILYSEIWALSGDILPVLWLSYHYLPSHLKRCFAYCAIIPKDYNFTKNELVLLWMAVGLLPPSRERNQIEDFGGKYFDDLLSRSLFQKSTRKESQFVMHDLVSDLAESVAGGICFRFEDKWERTEISKRARHSSYTRQDYDVFQKFKDFDKVRHLRTFLSLSNQKGSLCYLSNKILIDLVLKLKCIRALSLSSYDIRELPNSIGELKHLRDLNLSFTLIKSLPASVCTLYNLQTLSVHGCSDLYNLPAEFGNLVNLRHLDNANTEKLQEMPSGISKLTSLQTMSKFVVGNRLKLRELKDIMLRGSLSIKGLQDVMDCRDAKEANLRLKHDLDELELVWNRSPAAPQDEKLQSDVLDMLQPQRNLKKLKIGGYPCSKLSSWIGDPSFREVTVISLIDCRSCMSLPPLGQMPKLKHLTIEGMFGIKNTGFGFYNDDHSSEVPFPSLESLCFKDIPEWEEWSNSRGGEEVGLLFPCLRKFTISGCQNLVRIPLIRLPSLSHLSLQKCDGVVLKSFLDVTLLSTLEIKNVTSLSCLHKEFLQFCGVLESLYIGYCTKLMRLWPNGFKLQSLVCLKKLDVWHCPQLETFGAEEQGLPCNLECLTLMSCDNLEKLPSIVAEEQGFSCNLEHLTLIDCGILEKLPNGTNNLVSLRKLFVQRCPKLVSVGEQEQGLPPNLEVLILKDCNNLEKLPNGLSSLKSLVRLHISRCSKLVSFPRSAVPAMLKTLYIESCGALKVLPDHGADISHLEVLVIKHCSSLINVNLLTATTLQKLEVRNCPNLESKWMELQQHDNIILMSSLISKSMQNFANLGWLHISYCDGLESFPERGWPATPKLRHLEIMICNNFKSLPFNKFSRNLASLEFLRILRCPKLESFPDGDLPANLTTLRIQRCGELLKPLPEWGLHRLTSLRILRIDGSGYPEMVSLSDDHKQPLIPPTVAELWIAEFPNLENLSKVLQNLTYLEDLRIYDCPKLRSLPEGEVLFNLSSLTIFGCPILKQQCLPKDKGYYWPIIAGIPKVEIDHSSIY